MSTATKKVKVDLKGLIASASPETTRKVWIEFEPGIRFLVSYLPRAKMKALVDKSSITAFDPQTRQRVKNPDPAKLNRAFVDECIHDWEGITIRSLRSMLPIQVEGIPEDQFDDPIPFDPESMVNLMLEVYNMDTFFNDAVTDIKTFNPELEDELKNSKSSQGGS